MHRVPRDPSFTSILFTPALRVDRFETALRSGAAVTLADLEDSVSESKKEEARSLAGTCLSLRRPKTARVAVRVNALDSSVGLADMDAVLGAASPPDLILIPKVESAQMIVSAERMIQKRGAKCRLLALVETVEGVHRVEEIARSCASLTGLVFGSADYTRDMGGEISWDSLLYPRSRIVSAAKLCGIQAIDTPYFDIEDAVGLADETRRVKGMGFTGRCVIHPSQIDTVESSFSTAEDALDRAKRIVEAAEAAGGGICRVDGAMVGTPIIERAMTLLKNAEVNARIRGERSCQE